MTLHETVMIMQIVMGATLSVVFIAGAFLVFRHLNWEWKNRAKDQDEDAS